MSPETQLQPLKAEASTDSGNNHSAELQTKADELMGTLDSLDFSDMRQVVDFVSELQTPSDNQSVQLDRDRILNTFAAHGFEASAVSNSEVDENNREEFGKHIVLNALDMLQHDGYIGRVVPHFAGVWRSKFEADTTETDKEN